MAMSRDDNYSVVYCRCSVYIPHDKILTMMLVSTSYNTWCGSVVHHGKIWCEILRICCKLFIGCECTSSGNADHLGGNASFHSTYTQFPSQKIKRAKKKGRRRGEKRREEERRGERERERERERAIIIISWIPSRSQVFSSNVHACQCLSGSTSAGFHLEFFFAWGGRQWRR